MASISELTRMQQESEQEVAKQNAIAAKSVPMQVQYTANHAGATRAIQDYVSLMNASGYTQEQISRSLEFLPVMPIDAIAFCNGAIFNREDYTTTNAE